MKKEKANPAKYDHVLSKLAEISFVSLLERKTDELRDIDVIFISRFIRDENEGYIKADVKGFLFKMGWADEFGNLFDGPTGDERKDELIARLKDILGDNI